jgi:methenyltetrahydromethanopterin cyclohydrolase
MSSLNEKAWVQLDTTIASADRLGIIPQTMPCGTLVVDAGVHAHGGISAGLAMARIGMAGMSDAWMEMRMMESEPWPAIMVQSDHPLEACFLSQAAHWQVDIDGYRAMGSGPACLLNKALDPGKPFGSTEKSNRAVLVVEAPGLPSDAVCQALAVQCGIISEQLALIVAPTSSLAGSVQIAARSVETALHKLHTLNVDLKAMAAAFGCCPMAQPTGDDMLSLGKTNDVVMFGCQVWLAALGIPDNSLAEIVKKVPSSTSPSYGEPFLKTLKNAGGFYNIDPGLFAPAEVTITNLDTGAVFHAGKQDHERLLKTLKGRA